MRGGQWGAWAAGGLGAGVLLAASLPPWGWWPLAPVGAAVLVGLLAGQPWWRRLLAGGAAGLGLFGPGLWWVTEFSGPGYVVLVLLEAAVLAGAMLTVPPRHGRLVAFPAALVAAEAFRGHWPFGGLPLAGIALGQAGGPLAVTARLGGSLLIVAVVGASGVALAAGADAAQRVRRTAKTGMAGAGTGRAGVAGAGTGRAGMAALAAAGLVAATVTWAALASRGSAGRSIRVAAVQGGGVRGLRAISVDPASVFEAQLAATREIRGPVDLVVWPEDVVHVDGPLAGSPQDQAVADVARSLRATVVAGVVEEDVEPGRFRNAAVAWRPDGSRAARYDKVRRVPFGEFVPGRGLIRHLADLSAVPRDAIAGRGPGRLQTPVGPLGVVISYEVFFAGRARAAIRAGGQLLLVPTNASSFRTSQVPTQELAAARLRALETGREVVQAAPTGYTAVVDADARVHARSRLGGPAVVIRTVRLRGGHTIAGRLGDGPPTILAGLAVAAAWGGASRRRRQET